MKRIAVILGVLVALSPAAASAAISPKPAAPAVKLQRFQAMPVPARFTVQRISVARVGAARVDAARYAAALRVRWSLGGQRALGH